MTLDDKLGQLTNAAPAIPRLGISAYSWWTEGLHGLSTDIRTTNFPEPIGLAASFDDEMLQRVAGAISGEVRANYVLKRRANGLGGIGNGLDVWAPNINIFRDPRWGRGQETYGEDPFLTGRMGVAYIRGMQGPDAAKPLVIATPKHFAVHSGPEPTRHTVNIDVSRHDLEDTYLPAFRAAIVDGKAGSIMCSYNAVNGQPACANDFLLKEKLRGAWGFKGYVVSDCDAVTDIANPRKYAPDTATAVSLAFRAGVDNECTIDSVFKLPKAKQRYADAVAKGLLTEQEVDRTLVRLFAARFRVGDLGDAKRSASLGRPADLNSPAHQALALESAEKSIVLLKNDGVLPFQRSNLRVAVIGPFGDSARVLRGNYSSGYSPKPVTVLDGLRTTMPRADIRYVPAGAFAGDGEVVPSSVLRTPDGKPGLRAEYFGATAANAKPIATVADMMIGAMRSKYDPKPAFVTVDPEVDVLTRMSAPKGVPDQYRVTWTGYLVPKETGTYRLGLKGLGGEMIFEGKPWARVAGYPPTLGDMKVVKLEAGHRYAISIAAPKLGLVDVHLVWKRISETPEVDAAAAARDADIVVAVVGLNSELEGEQAAVSTPGFEGGDRTSLDMPADEQKLLEAAKATGKPLVVVLMNGSALNLAWAKENANAIVEAWYSGQQGGAAVARVLAGLTNPGGRLPLTFYRDVTDLPPFTDYSMRNRTYRYFAGTPIYPFGYGLSYTQFAYSPLKLAQADNVVTVSTIVRNTGKRAGDEVAQVYLQFPDAPGAPRIALRGFNRFHLAPGQSRTLTFRLNPRDLSSVSEQGDRRVGAGTYRISVGGGQPGTGLPAVQATFAVPTELPVKD